MNVFDEVMADTVGVVYRAATGKPDPWTIALLQQDQVAGVVGAGGSPAAAAAQAAQDVPAAINSSPATQGGFIWGAQSALGLQPGSSLPSFSSSTALEYGVIILILLILLMVI